MTSTQQIKYEILPLSLALIILFVGVPFAYYAMTGNSELPKVTRECIDSHISTVNELNANNKITYDEPREICDVEKIGNTYRYSYNFQKNYDKPWWTIYPDCFGTTRADWDEERKVFVCSDGSIAKEVRFDY